MADPQIAPWVRSVCLTAALVSSSIASAAPEELLGQINNPDLDLGAAVSVRDVELALGPATLAIQRGFLIPAVLSDGRAIEAVFVGQARFRLDASDPTEAGQLELFTAQTAIDAAVEEAVLVLPREDAIPRLLERRHDQKPRAALLDRATDLYERWLVSTERRTTGIDASIFKALAGDAAFQDYFAAWCHSFEIGDFLYRLDPEEVEQVTLASFNPVELSDWASQRLRHKMRVQRRKGRWLGRRFEDVGGWDIWLSTSWSADGAARPGRDGFEAEHYDLDATIRRDRMMLDARARLTLVAQVDGRRAVRLELQHDLLVESVRDERNRELFFFRSGEQVVVLLPEAVRAGDRLKLDIDYAGRALAWIDGNNFDLSDTGTWYPHAGTIDRATYDVTLRWPKRYTLLAGGHLVEQGRDGNYRWERRTLDVPAIAFSFVIGEFDIHRLTVGDVELTVGFSRTAAARTNPGTQAQVIESVKSSLEFFEAAFGPYPLSELTVVTVPRRYSQSYLGFVTLARSLMGYTGHRGSASDWFKETTVAHEMAHQWWGNLVGWWSYRDQWLSEAMANYAALLFEGRGRNTGESMLSIMSAGWRDSLTLTTPEGRTIESIGPVVLGNRLNSSKAPDAYRPIVYRKGAVVLAMLARAVGERTFLEMLHSLVQAASNRVLTTDEFLRSIERMSGLDLDGFAQQYIYGTGIPQVYYDYELAENRTGGWVLQGEARRLRDPRYHYEIVETARGGWDLRREVIFESDSGPTTLMVPFRVTLAAGRPAEGTTRLSMDGPRSGKLFLDGPLHRFEIAAVQRPSGLSLDPAGEILASFYSADADPKRYLRFHAQNLTLAGDLESAEAGFRKALEVPVNAHGEDLRTRLFLARLYLDQGRSEEARQELDVVDADLALRRENELPLERAVLRSRLELLGGDPAPARRRLKRALRLAAEGDRQRGYGDRARIHPASEKQAVAEAYALLAIAAHQGDRRQERQWAAEEAANRGVDVSALARPGSAEPE